MSDVLGSDYIRAARLKGLQEGSVIFRHALPNSLAPAVAVISLDIGYLLGGIIVVEEIFAWPGLGRLLIYALENRDLPVIQAITLVLATVYALSNLLSDIVIAASGSKGALCVARQPDEMPRILQSPTGLIGATLLSLVGICGPVRTVCRPLQSAGVPPGRSAPGSVMDISGRH